MPRSRVGIVGLKDRRVWPAMSEWAALPGVSLSAAVDPDSEILAKARVQFQIPRIYRSWQEMLLGEDLHYIHVASPPEERAPLVEEAAARGIHLLLEGPMASTLDQAERMVAACRLHGSRLLVRWPAAYDVATAHAFHLLQDEEVGGLIELTHRRTVVREASAPLQSDVDPGEPPDYKEEREAVRQAISYCADGVNLCRAAIGVPYACTTVLSRLDPARCGFPTHALTILHYHSAVAVLSGSGWPGPTAVLPDLVLRGVSGVIVVNGAIVSVAREGAAWPGEIVVPLTEGEYRSGPQQLVESVNRDMDVGGFVNAQVGRDTQEILEAAEHSVELQRTVCLPIR